MAPRKRTFRQWTVFVPNPKTGRDVEVTFTRHLREDTEEWWDVRAIDFAEKNTVHPRGVIGEGMVVFDPPSISDYGNMHEPHAYVMNAGAGLVMYLGATLLAGMRGRKGIRASDTLSHESKRLWNKMLEHGLATNRGVDVGPVGAILVGTAEAWIADYRKARP